MKPASLSFRCIGSALGLGLVIGACFGVCARAAHAAGRVDPPSPVRLVTSLPKDGELRSVLDQALDLVMKRAGLTYTLADEPFERALLSFRNGLYEAEATRVAQFDQVAPGAIRVDPHLLSVTIRAFSREGVNPQSWSDLKRYKIAYLRGTRSIALNLQPGQSVELTSTTNSCLAMAAAGRVDTCLLAAWTEVPAQLRGQLRSQPLWREPLYMWVRPDQAELARRLALAIQATLSSGELARTVGTARDP